MYVKYDSFLFDSVSYSRRHYINCILSSWLFIISMTIRERNMGGVFWEESGNVGKSSSCILFFSEPTPYVINSVFRVHFWGPCKDLAWQGPPSSVSGSSVLHWATKSKNRPSDLSLPALLPAVVSNYTS